MYNKCQIEVTPQVLDYFESVLDQEKIHDESKIIRNAKSTLKKALSTRSNQFLVEHLNLMKLMIKMLNDQQWKTNQKNRKRILNVMNYLTRNDDLIPDEIPQIGLIDDCVMIKIVSDQLKLQLESYQQFKQAEKVYAKNGEFRFADWMTIKRKELFSRVRARRNCYGKY